MRKFRPYDSLLRRLFKLDADGFLFHVLIINITHLMIITIQLALILKMKV